MKRWLMVFVAAVAVMACAFAVGCSGDSDKYHVYKIDDAQNGYVEYDIVYYDNRSNYDGPVMTGFVDETHYNKNLWTQSEIESVCADIYPGIDDMSFVSMTITDEGDYYCCIVEFKGLDKLDNLTELYKTGALFSNASNQQKAESLVSATSFENSIKIQGGKLIEDDDVKDLDLHYSFGKK